MNYTLEEGIEYSLKGEVVVAQFISFEGPSPRHIQDLAPVKAEVTKAVQWAQEQNDVESEDADDVATEGKEISPRAMMSTLELAPGIEIAKTILHVKNMLIKGRLAMVDGESKLTDPLYEKLIIKDVYGITGFFIANFILPSL